MKIKLNGEEREVEAGLSLASLAQTLGLDVSKIVVEHNHSIVAREALAEVEVSQGDAVEIVRFVGGG